MYQRTVLLSHTWCKLFLVPLQSSIENNVYPTIQHGVLRPTSPVVGGNVPIDTEAIIQLCTTND